MPAINFPEDAAKEASRCSQCNEPNCIGWCPLGIGIPVILDLVAAGKFNDAARHLREKSPFASITGRLCPSHRLCESGCTLGIKGKPISFCAIERFLGDLSLGMPVTKGMGEQRSALVVGSGPAGITVAHDLFVEGMAVQIWERKPVFGGWLRLIPQFRLPPGILDREIERLRMSGLHLEPKKELAEISPEITAQFDTVALATGEPSCQRRQRSTVAEALENALLGIVPDAQAVIIAEGSDGAVDLARQLVRVKPGLRVSIRGKITGDAKNARHAADEGVSFERLSTCTLARSERIIIGGECLHAKPQFKIKSTSDGHISVDSNFMTSVHGVFATGCAVARISSVTEAMAMGRELARGIMFQKLSHPPT